MTMLSEHFSEREFACRCCGLLNVDPEFIKILEFIRTGYGKPMKVLSGCRCAKHNKAVKGSKFSYHLATKNIRSCAADIEVLTGEDRYRLVMTALSFNVTGIGVYPEKGFIHLDVGKERRPSLW